MTAPDGLGRLPRAAFLVALGLVSSCAHLGPDPPDPDPGPVPAHPGPGESSTRAGPEGGASVEAFIPRHAAFDLRLELLEEASAYDRYRLSASTYSESRHEFKTLEGEYYRSRRIPRGEAGPLIIISPILGGEESGYFACHIFGGYACRDGISAFFLYQDESILDSELDGLGLEALLREIVRDNLGALALLRARAEVDSRRLGTLGISLGAIRNILIVAAEPRLRANIMVMGGVDLASILLESREPGVEGYFRRRMRREGITRAEACAEIRRHLSSEPARFAGRIDPDRVVLLLARFDDKVPLKYGQLLREKLGGPETYILPGGHYTSILLAPYAAAKGFGYMLDRFEDVTRTPAEK